MYTKVSPPPAPAPSNTATTSELRNLKILLVLIQKLKFIKAFAKQGYYNGKVGIKILKGSLFSIHYLFLI